MEQTGRSISGAPSIFITAAAIASGVLSGTSVAVTSYVYFRFPHPAGIQHVAIPGKTLTHLESIESYLFAIPCLQVALFLGLALAALMWPAVIRRLIEREARYAAKYPSLRNSDSIQGYKIVMAIAVIFEAFMFLFTAYRSLMLATNNIG